MTEISYENPRCPFRTWSIRKLRRTAAIIENILLILMSLAIILFVLTFISKNFIVTNFGISAEGLVWIRIADGLMFYFLAMLYIRDWPDADDE
jgi:hypothetical protein